MKVLRKIIIKSLFETEIPATSDVIASFPEMDGMYVKQMYGDYEKGGDYALQFLYPGDEEKASHSNPSDHGRQGILFYPEMELRYSKDGEVLSDYYVKEFKLPDGKPDLHQIARRLYLLKADPINESWFKIFGATRKKGVESHGQYVIDNIKGWSYSEMEKGKFGERFEIYDENGKLIGVLYKSKYSNVLEYALEGNFDKPTNWKTERNVSLDPNQAAKYIWMQRAQFAQK